MSNDNDMENKEVVEIEEVKSIKNEENNNEGEGLKNILTNTSQVIDLGNGKVSIHHDEDVINLFNRMNSISLVEVEKMCDQIAILKSKLDEVTEKNKKLVNVVNELINEITYYRSEIDRIQAVADIVSSESNAKLDITDDKAIEN